MWNLISLWNLLEGLGKETITRQAINHTTKGIGHWNTYRNQGHNSNDRDVVGCPRNTDIAKSISYCIINIQLGIVNHSSQDQRNHCIEWSHDNQGKNDTSRNVLLRLFNLVYRHRDRLETKETKEHEGGTRHNSCLSSINLPKAKWCKICPVARIQMEEPH